MSLDMIAPEWMHSQITAAEYDSWSEEQCAGIEIVDGTVVVSPSASPHWISSRSSIGGYARALSLSHVDSHAMCSGCLRSSQSGAESSTDNSATGCSNSEGGNTRHSGPGATRLP